MKDSALVPFSASERKILMATPMVGRKLVGYLEGLGIDTLGTLASLEEAQLARLVAHHSGLPGWETHALARVAVRNAIAAAQGACS